MVYVKTEAYMITIQKIIKIFFAIKCHDNDINQNISLSLLRYLLEDWYLKPFQN